MKNIFTLALLLVAVMAELHRREDMSSIYGGRNGKLRRYDIH